MSGRAIPEFEGDNRTGVVLLKKKEAQAILGFLSEFRVAAVNRSDGYDRDDLSRAHRMLSNQLGWIAKREEFLRANGEA